jgi:hypothetical protein
MTSREHGSLIRRSLFAAVDALPGGRPALVNPDGNGLTEHGRRIERNCENWRPRGYMPDVDPENPGEWAPYVAGLIDASGLAKLDDRVLRIATSGVAVPTPVLRRAIHNAFELHDAAQFLGALRNQESSDVSLEDLIEPSVWKLTERLTAMASLSRRPENLQTRLDLSLLAVLQAQRSSSPEFVGVDVQQNAQDVMLSMFAGTERRGITDVARFARHHEIDASDEQLGDAADTFEELLPLTPWVLSVLLDRPEQAVPQMGVARQFLSSIAPALDGQQLDLLAVAVGCLMYLNTEGFER